MPAKDPLYQGDTLLLGPRKETYGMHMPIDTFMHALAQQKRNRAVGVILSGTRHGGNPGPGRRYSRPRRKFG
jgi:two-component system, chemotaxis family, CheB/CheR fusion protein